MACIKAALFLSHVSCLLTAVLLHILNVEIQTVHSGIAGSEAKDNRVQPDDGFERSYWEVVHISLAHKSKRALFLGQDLADLDEPNIHPALGAGKLKGWQESKE